MEQQIIPDVSVIIRTYRRPTLLTRALTSLVNQEYKKFEVIVVEDGPPISKEIIKKFNNLNIKYISTKTHIGRSAAGNKGLDVATGKYINFLDDDDILQPDHIQILSSELDAHPDICAVHSSSIERKVIYESYQPLRVKTRSEKYSYSSPLNKQEIFYRNMFPIQAVMFRRNLFLNFGGFDEKLEYLEDWDLWIKYSLHGQFLFIDRITSIYHIPGKKSELRARKKIFKRYEVNILSKYTDYISINKIKSPSIFNKMLKKLREIVKANSL
ncbi:glycosyltransferase [Paenibacillus solani]|uniref:Glycosyltransferase 2-like domain-containing protein n=1 Tax=Paenibacillus solani TaxID=1705565 RepID=A0A0M1N2G1_9BACL|nr:glycosyltransferase [Paenibacillus solani]KOR76333.1 hypothetical protein AM231_27355 [Paenibacillus solani]